MAQPTWMTQAGLINGYAMKDIRLSYDSKTDTLAVAVNFYGIAGNTDGTANGGTNPLTIAAGGSNPPHIGGDKSISIAFTPYSAAGTNADPVVVAGVPANKGVSPAGSLDGFDVATVNATALHTSGLGQAYGMTLTGNLGNLAYDPSAAHPDFEFTIPNFSKIPGLNALTNGFYVSGLRRDGKHDHRRQERHLGYLRRPARGPGAQAAREPGQRAHDWQHHAGHDGQTPRHPRAHDDPGLGPGRGHRRAAGSPSAPCSGRPGLIRIQIHP